MTIADDADRLAMLADKLTDLARHRRDHPPAYWPKRDAFPGLTLTAAKLEIRAYLDSHAVLINDHLDIQLREIATDLIRIASRMKEQT